MATAGAHRAGRGLAPVRLRRNSYLDAISSWWTNLFGHRHPVIVERIKQQLDRLDHVLLAGFTHAGAVELAERLCALAPAGLNRCFYADNGSAAVEVALKMSAHFWLNTGSPHKTRFITLSNGYHGETLGALGAGASGLYRDPYRRCCARPSRCRRPTVSNVPRRVLGGSHRDSNSATCRRHWTPMPPPWPLSSSSR